MQWKAWVNSSLKLRSSIFILRVTRRHKLFFIGLQAKDNNSCPRVLRSNQSRSNETLEQEVGERIDRPGNGGDLHVWEKDKEELKVTSRFLSCVMRCTVDGDLSVPKQYWNSAMPSVLPRPQILNFSSLLSVCIN